MPKAPTAGAIAESVGCGGVGLKNGRTKDCFHGLAALPLESSRLLEEQVPVGRREIVEESCEMKFICSSLYTYTYFPSSIYFFSLSHTQALMRTHVYTRTHPHTLFLHISFKCRTFGGARRLRPPPRPPPPRPLPPPPQPPLRPGQC